MITSKAGLTTSLVLKSIWNKSSGNSQSASSSLGILWLLNILSLSISLLDKELKFEETFKILFRSLSWNIYGIPSADTWTSVSIYLQPSDFE